MTGGIRYLNLYAGIGGNRAKLPKNVSVVAVEKNERIAEIYKNLYPDDRVIVYDAHAYLQENYSLFDFIWSSPPCPTHSRMNLSGLHKKRRFPDLRLYEEIIFLKTWAKVPFCVENVIPYYEPLIPGKKIGRHLFWSNFTIRSQDCEVKRKGSFIELDGTAGRRVMSEHLGISVDETTAGLTARSLTRIYRNCVHPDTGLNIFLNAMGIVKPAVQPELF